MVREVYSRDDDAEVERSLPVIEADAARYRAHLKALYPDMDWVHDATMSQHNQAVSDGMEFHDMADLIALKAVIDFWGVEANPIDTIDSAGMLGS